MKTTHPCEICERRYTHMPDAITCESQRPTDIDEPVAIGDVVRCTNVAHSWWSGDKAWTAPRPADMTSSNHFDHYDGFIPLWVVVDKFIGLQHEVRYVLWTPSHADGQESFGTTSRNHHHPRFERGSTPEELASAVTALEGKNYRRIGIV